jgi:hypothetical protein
MFSSSLIRLAHNGNLVGETEKLKSFASKGKCIFKREVLVARRSRALPYDRRIHPERQAREATLAVSAVSVELRDRTTTEPRWTIEEFFEALKTGCQFEKRQLESFHALTNALALFLPIAARLLALRSAARVAPTALCTSLSERQIHLLLPSHDAADRARPTNEQGCLALAFSLFRCKFPDSARARRFQVNRFVER